MDLDGMMKQMMMAMNPDGANQDMANNPFAQMMNSAGPDGPLDDAKLNEASKMFEDCINQIQKETDEYHAQQKAKEDTEEPKPAQNTAQVKVNEGSDDPIIAGNDSSNV